MRDIYLIRKQIKPSTTLGQLGQILKDFYREYMDKRGIGYGCCLETALVVNDCFFRAKMVMCLHPKYVVHYWNMLPDGQEIDFTRDQLSQDALRGLTVYPVDRLRATATEAQAQKYYKLRDFVVRRLQRSSPKAMKFDSPKPFNH